MNKNLWRIPVVNMYEGWRFSNVNRIDTIDSLARIFLDSGRKLRTHINRAFDDILEILFRMAKKSRNV